MVDNRKEFDLDIISAYFDHDNLKAHEWSPREFCIGQGIALVPGTTMPIADLALHTRHEAEQLEKDHARWNRKDPNEV